jgi:hypothetical protein
MQLRTGGTLNVSGGKARLQQWIEAPPAVTGVSGEIRAASEGSGAGLDFLVEVAAGREGTTIFYAVSGSVQRLRDFHHHLLARLRHQKDRPDYVLLLPDLRAIGKCNIRLHGCLNPEN